MLEGINSNDNGEKASNFLKSLLKKKTNLVLNKESQTEKNMKEEMF